MKTNKTSYKKSSRGLAKHVATILLAGAMVFPVALSASACRVTITDNGDGTFNIDPANPNEQDNNTGNSQGSTNTPQGGQTTPKEPDYSKYSPLLQEVLNDPYYDELYRMWKNAELHFENLLCAIPYEFLESIGENVEDIKKSTMFSGLVGISSALYTMENEPNYIYNRLYVYHSTDGKLWFDNENRNIHQYLLQYKITEQELKDLTMLYNGDYFQGPVMFQRLASKQTPKVIAEFGITESAYNQLLNSLNKNEIVKQSFGSVVSSFTITSFRNNSENIKNYDMELTLFHYGTGLPVWSGEIAGMSALVDDFSGVQYVDNIIDWTHINNRYLNEQVGASTPITYFHLSHSFRNFKDRL